MKQNLTNETSALVVGLGIAIGECIFGVNGPFLLSRFGLNVPGAAVLGVLIAPGNDVLNMRASCTLCLVGILHRYEGDYHKA